MHTEPVRATPLGVPKRKTWEAPPLTVPEEMPILVPAEAPEPLVPVP